jgi:hypothetical protein
MAGAAAGAVFALWRARASWLAGCVASFAAGGALLSLTRGRTPAIVVEGRVRRAAQRGELTPAAGRNVPEDASAFAVVGGVLQSDASAGAAAYR